VVPNRTQRSPRDQGMTDRQTLAEVVATLGTSPTALQVAKALKQLDTLDAEAAGLKSIRLGVVSSFTFDLLVKPLVARGYADDLRLSVYNAPYGQFFQELVNPQSGLHQHRPDAILLAVRLQDVCPDLYLRFNALSAPDIDALVTRWRNDFAEALEAFRRHSAARVLCTNYELPAYPSLGLAERRTQPSQLATLQALNDWLYELGARIADFHVVDLDAAAARCGRAHWTDPKLMYYARAPIAADCYWEYAGEITRVLRAITGKARKVLALDCDETLWGGILGDVGPTGILLGQDYPGNAYVALQRRALELYHRGVVLVVASKNDPAMVKEVFTSHPEMVLRPEHIAWFAVNWQPKPENLKQAAAGLNLGLDSFVFLDDHPVECAMMRELAPEVLTVQLPEDPALFEQTLARLTCFDQLAVSAEDRQRGAMYAQEAARAELKASAGDLESFYRGLQMKATLAVNRQAQLGRIAQLTQRTNQFNMTTVRRTESEVLALMQQAGTDVVTLRLVDRFGDNGIVGLAISQRQAEECVLDTFLMSCRVLGRTVEQMFLSWVALRARQAGAMRLVGRFIPTKKNRSFGGFYESWGMKLEAADPDGSQRWVYDLTADGPALVLPPWIDVQVL
jgi:FkbH-like protein